MVIVFLQKKLFVSCWDTNEHVTLFIIYTEQMCCEKRKRNKSMARINEMLFMGKIATYHNYYDEGGLMFLPFRMLNLAIVGGEVIYVSWEIGEFHVWNLNGDINYFTDSLTVADRVLQNFYGIKYSIIQVLLKQAEARK